MIAFWITQFFSQNLTQERDLKYYLSKCTQRKKKYDKKKSILGWKYSISTVQK
jgi:hypothetical protein